MGEAVKGLGGLGLLGEQLLQIICNNLDVVVGHQEDGSLAGLSRGVDARATMLVCAIHFLEKQDGLLGVQLEQSTNAIDLLHHESLIQYDSSDEQLRLAVDADEDLVPGAEQAALRVDLGDRLQHQVVLDRNSILDNVDVAGVVRAAEDKNLIPLLAAPFAVFASHYAAGCRPPPLAEARGLLHC